MPTQPHQSVPGLPIDKAADTVSILQRRLVGTIGLQLALKHVHWNVVGPDFLSVHEMLDDQVVPVREMTDEIAERIATLGGVPDGRAGTVVSQRDWEDYPLGRDSVFAHLEELNDVYCGVIADHRAAIAEVGDLDPVTEDLLIGQTAKLELFQWFIRSFIERADQGAGRAPTAAEAAAAERHAGNVDLNSVEDSYREMTATGAAVQGEGAIA